MNPVKYMIGYITSYDIVKYQIDKSDWTGSNSVLKEVRVNQKRQIVSALCLTSFEFFYVDSLVSLSCFVIKDIEKDYMFMAWRFNLTNQHHSKCPQSCL